MMGENSALSITSCRNFFKAKKLPAYLYAAGHERRARRRVQRRRVEVIEMQPVRRELINVRCINQATEAADLGEADIVEQKA